MNLIELQRSLVVVQFQTRLSGRRVDFGSRCSRIANDFLDRQSIG